MINFTNLLMKYCLIFMHICVLINYNTHLKASYTGVSWWFSTGVWVTAKYHQVFWTLLSILVNLNNDVVLIISTRSLLYKSCCPCTSLWWQYRARILHLLSQLPSCSIVIFFSYFARSTYLSLFKFFLQYYPVVRRNGKIQYLANSLFFFLNVTTSNRLAEIRWYVCISKSNRMLCISFSRTDSGSFIWTSLRFWHNY